MQKNIKKNSKSRLANVWMLLIVFIMIIPACKKPFRHEKNYEQVNLVANNNEYGAARIDSKFVNGWGISFAPSGVVWVSVEATSLSEVWDKTGNEIRPAVTI